MLTLDAYVRETQPVGMLNTTTTAGNVQSREAFAIIQHISFLSPITALMFISVRAHHPKQGWTNAGPSLGTSLLYIGQIAFLDLSLWNLLCAFHWYKISPIWIYEYWLPAISLPKIDQLAKSRTGQTQTRQFSSLLPEATQSLWAGLPPLCVLVKYNVRVHLLIAYSAVFPEHLCHQQLNSLSILPTLISNYVQT